MTTSPPGSPPTVAVVGGSLAGLFAAAAASTAGHRVTVLDRDELTADTLAHPGVPQGRQPHVYLLRGLRAAEELLPGVLDELRAAGAVDLETGRLATLSEQGWLPIRDADMVGLSMSRPLFERVVRRRVLALPGVTLLAGRPVTGLRRPGGPDRPWRVVTTAGEIAADLVVDASGRASRLPAWLPTLGVGVPTTEEVDARIGYAAREFTDVPELHELSGILVGATPESGRGGLALPIEDGHWVVLASGSGDRRPPRDVDGFMASLRAERDPALVRVAERARPVDDVLIYRRNGNRRHRYDRCRNWPAGLLAVGDSFVSFNPIYGQGITVAALDALVLRDALTAAAGRPFDRRDTRRVMRRLARVAGLPWAIATGADLRQPTSSGHQNRAQRMTSAWVRELNRQAVHGSERAHLAVQSLAHLIGSPAGLVHPALLVGVTRGRIGRRHPAATRPDGLDLLDLVEDPPPGAGAGAGATDRPSTDRPGATDRSGTTGTGDHHGRADRPDAAAGLLPAPQGS